MRRKALFAAIFSVCFSLILSVTSASAYYTNMPASVVIGQPNFNTGTLNQGGSTSGANTLNGPEGVVMIGSKLVIVDDQNHRILIYNQLPTSNNASADVVIGQQNFTSRLSNQGSSTPTANTLSASVGLGTDGTKLIVADQNNHRVLIYNQVPTVNNTAADVVIGQATMLTRTPGNTQSIFRFPFGVFFDPQSGKLFVTDFSNNRVLIYNSIPTTNGAPADLVLGQADFTANSANRGGSAAADTLSGPIGGTVSNGRLFVVDRSNNRILVWNSIPTTNGAPADYVLGQSTFSGGSANQGGSVRANTMSLPAEAKVVGGRLYVSELTNNRVTIFNTIPTSSNALADVAIGQPNLNSNSVNQGTGVASNTLNVPWYFDFTPNNDKLIVVDGANHRVLIYNNDNTTPGLSIGSPESAENNLVKLSGTASTVTNYWIQNVQYMVNGGGFNGATATDGAFNSISEPFFFTFDPKSNNNTEDGYTVQMKSTTSNGDIADHLFYFQPFVLNTPADRSFISKPLPTFSFSVNKQQTQLKQNLQNYRIMVKKSGGDWETYVDTIPADYASVQNAAENLQPSTKATNGNGIYEDKKMLVSYSNNNSTLTVTPKAVDSQGNPSSFTFDQSGKLLNNGGYEWKVQAIDKNGHVQETETRKFVVGSSQFSNGSSWFPLQINSITGLGRVYLSTINPQLVKPRYRIQTGNPIFKGVATANSTVQLDLTNQTCLTTNGSNCIQTFSANANGASQFSLATSTNTLKTGSIYQAQFSVSQGGLFNALPPFLITR